MLSRAEIVGRAKAHVGHREVAANSSPLIDGWLRRCGAKPGDPWCAAFASWCIEQRAAQTHEVAMDRPQVLTVACAGALRLGRMFPSTRNPQPGDLMYFATDSKGSGHIGIVLAGVGLYEVLCIEGNSANCVRYTRRLRSQVLFASTRSEALPLAAADVQAPLVPVTYEGTR